MSSEFVVLKFGGTSVSTRERWETIESVARGIIAEGARPVIVCSAISGVSNLLDSLLSAALEQKHEDVLAQLRAKHAELATSLGVDMDALIGDDLAALGRRALGASLLGEVSPRLKAIVMSAGELMSTKLGAAFLSARGASTSWRDARDILGAIREENTNPQRHFLSAACDYERDDALRVEFAGLTEQVLLTQGFIARDDAGETVLLGRGGSDTSAAYMAAKLGATRLEIWTDVPGMFTANPRDIPSARLLRRLGYMEAQELATMGAKVLHPRCIDPVRAHGIPLHIKCTPHPHLEGTVIRGDIPDDGAQVKAISAKMGIPLVSISTVGMWQQVGFLADVFDSFKRLGISVDLVATSEANVTVSLDPVANALDQPTLSRLIEDLSGIAGAKQIGPCAAVSLVGRNIRAILHQLGPALEVFEEQHVYMMSQAASDLNLTFVVDEEQAERLVRKLHALIFGSRAQDALIGPTWRELFTEDHEPHEPMGHWWVDRRAELIAQVELERPAYVYDRATLTRAIEDLDRLHALDERYYAIKANPNEEILRLFYELGMCFESVSTGELAHLKRVLPELDPSKILFTPNFAPIGEYQKAFEVGAWVTLDNLHPLRHHPEVFRGREFLVRMDPGVGRGHHKHVRTAGDRSKFGVVPGELDELIELTKQVDARVVGVHAHVGSGIRASETWAENAVFLTELARALPDARIVNVGGGLGVPERPSDAPLEIEAVAQSLAAVKAANPDLELWMEPGRYCVAQAGVLLTTVTQLKQKGERVYVGVDTGMNSLIRPALYGAFHEIVNLTKWGEPVAITADVVGPICESGDVLGYGRRLPETEEGDVLLIGTAGAYGRVMASDYNLRGLTREVLV